MHVCVCCAQSHLSLCDHMNCSLPDSSIHGIFQVIILEWDAISFWPLNKEETMSHTWLKPKSSVSPNKKIAISKLQRKAWIVITSDLALPVKPLGTHQLYMTQKDTTLRQRELTVAYNFRRQTKASKMKIQRNLFQLKKQDIMPKKQLMKGKQFTRFAVSALVKI